MAKRTAKPAPVAVVEDDEEDLELEDLDETVEDEAPAKGKGRNRDAEVTFGIPHLVEYFAGKGVTVSKRDLRAQIRRMAREDTARVDRVITAGNKSRYDWPLGLKDPEVKRIIKAVQGGEVADAKKEQLQALKDRKAAKDAASPAKGKGKAKSAPVDVEDDEEFDEDED